MLQVRVMNSTTAGKTKVYPPETTVLDIMNDTAMAGILNSTNIMWNSEAVSMEDFDVPLSEFPNTKTDGTNVLIGLKAANGAA